MSSSRTCNFDAGGDPAIFRRIFGRNELMDDEDDDGDVKICVCVCVFEGMFFLWGSNVLFTLENKINISKIRCFCCGWLHLKKKSCS